MIILITGIPGTGKTLFTLDYCQKQFQSRVIYYHNIKGLKLHWHEITDVNEWYKLPTGSVIVIDEAHQIFKKTDGRQSPPIHIEKFDEHRHQGHDVILITQKATDLNTYIRNRVGRHIHLKRPISEAEKCAVYVFSKYEKNTDNQEILADADSYDFTYPKHLYSQYDSAEVHTVQRYVPKKLKKLLILLALSLSAVAYAANSVVTRFTHGREGVETDTTTEQVIEIKPFQNDTLPIMTIDDYLYSYTPRIASIPSSAPIYDELTSPKTYPVPSCISSATKCICHSQQGSKLEIEFKQCRHYVENGYFDSAKATKLTRVNY